MAIHRLQSVAVVISVLWGVLRWDGTDTHHTEARAQRLKSSYDVIWEGENNQHFVTTKQ